ncbi:MAG: hypothetical protein DMD83_22300, partial [Candidatus Rokuibacteriota bacterium]
MAVAAMASRIFSRSAAFDRDGSLYLTDGITGRLLRLQAPAAPVLDALPEWTNASPLTVSVTAQAGAQLDLFVSGVPDPIQRLADSSGRASLAVPLLREQASRLTVFATAAGGAGLTSLPGEATVAHDSVAPALNVSMPPSAAFVRGRVAVEVHAADAGSGVDRLALDAGGRRLSGALAPT